MVRPACSEPVMPDIQEEQCPCPACGELVTPGVQEEGCRYPARMQPLTPNQSSLISLTTFQTKFTSRRFTTTGSNSGLNGMRWM